MLSSPESVPQSAHSNWQSLQDSSSPPSFSQQDNAQNSFFRPNMNRGFRANNANRANPSYRSVIQEHVNRVNPSYRSVIQERVEGAPIPSVLISGRISNRAPSPNTRRPTVNVGGKRKSKKTRKQKQ
jgi:hypothetical protein